MFYAFSEYSIGILSFIKKEELIRVNNLDEILS